MNVPFRELHPREKELLERLLDLEFLGRDELRLQLPFVTAREVEKDGTLVLRCSQGPPAPGNRAVPAGGVCWDADSVPISVMLHVDQDGFMRRLEITKFDSSPIIVPPTARSLVVET
jgi:hypothetical protein